ncbi:MAG: hypothetical protein R3331_11750 [Sulfurospirillaceae bacterium]|nr:hypothetical protein [Sulfurospirillaceae bacterium]
MPVCVVPWVMIKTVPMIAPVSTRSSCRSTLSCLRMTAMIVTMTGGRQSAISVGTAAPICSIPKNQSNT